MAPEPQKTLDQEVRELISTLTTRFSSIQGGQKFRDGSTSSNHTIPNEDESGVSVITLAGTNLGATMRGDMSDDKAPQGLSLPEHEDFATYVNSNFQAINNSIMLGGSYNTNDPGVHLDISDCVDHHAPQPKRGNAKGKKHERGGLGNGHAVITQHSE